MLDQVELVKAGVVDVDWGLLHVVHLPEESFVGECLLWLPDVFLYEIRHFIHQLLRVFILLLHKINLLFNIQVIHKVVAVEGVSSIVLDLLSLLAPEGRTGLLNRL